MKFKDVQFLIQEFEKGNRAALSKAITFMETKRPEQRKIAADLLQKLYSKTGKSMRIGITGVPGAGKSTFIEALGNQLADKGKKVAVLAIDPSSETTHGSILGDKTRMELLSKHPNAFIRPTATAGKLGGVSGMTYETMLLCEAFGFEVIFIETVGVGQSEYEIAHLSDFVLFLKVPGTGDDLQGIKRGIMEVVDMVFINKADGVPDKLLNQARADILSAVKLQPQSKKIDVLSGSSLTLKGIPEIWQSIENWFVNNEAIIHQRREKNAQRRFDEILRNLIIEKVFSELNYHSGTPNKEILKEIPPIQVAMDMLERLKISTTHVV